MSQYSVPLRPAVRVAALKSGRGGMHGSQVRRREVVADHGAAQPHPPVQLQQATALRLLSLQGLQLQLPHTCNSFRYRSACLSNPHLMRHALQQYIWLAGVCCLCFRLA